MRGCPAVSDKISDAGDEGTQGEIDIPYDVKRQPVPRQDDREKGEVGEELEEVWNNVSKSIRHGKSLGDGNTPVHSSE